MRLVIAFFACLTALTSLAADEPGNRYLHNGSVMRVYWGEGDNMSIIYEQPRAGLGVSAGTVLFDGVLRANDEVHGDAFVFASDCRPAKYRVKGRFIGNDIVLEGQAPIMRIGHCWTTGLEWNSNSYLRFDYISD